jgi:hypothetical protein
LFDFVLFLELLKVDLLSDMLLLGLELFNFLQLLVFGLLQVEFDVLDGGVVEGRGLAAGGEEGLEVGDLDDGDSFADELFVEIVLMVHFGLLNWKVYNSVKIQIKG